MIDPDPDDELPSSPPFDYPANTDTILLISRTRENYFYKVIVNGYSLQLHLNSKHKYLLE